MKRTVLICCLLVIACTVFFFASRSFREGIKPDAELVSSPSNQLLPLDQKWVFRVRIPEEFSGVALALRIRREKTDQKVEATNEILAQVPLNPESCIVAIQFIDLRKLFADENEHSFKLVGGIEIDGKSTILDTTGDVIFGEIQDVDVSETFQWTRREIRLLEFVTRENKSDYQYEITLALSEADD